MSELVPLSDAEVDELEVLQEKCLKKDGEFKARTTPKDRDRLIELETRVPEDDTAEGVKTTTAKEAPTPAKAKPAKSGASFRIAGDDPYRHGALGDLNKLLADQDKEPVFLPLTLVPDKTGNALEVLRKYRIRCAGAGTQDAVRLKACEDAIVAFGGSLEKPKKPESKKK